MNLKKLFAEYIDANPSRVKATRDMMEFRSRAFVERFAKVKSLDAIDAAALNKWVASLYESGMKPSTISRRLVEAKGFLRWCADPDRKLRTAADLDFRQVAKVKQAKSNRPFFTPEQYEQLLDVARGHRNIWWPDLIMIGWHTGLRLSDCCALPWSAVDWKQELLHIAIKKLAYLGQELTVPIEPALLMRLHCLWENEEHKPQVRKSAYVIPEAYAYYGVQPSTMRLEFCKLCDLAKLPRHSFHGLRHGFVSRLINSGVAPQIISAITGQAVQTITRYSHVSEEAKAQAMRRSREWIATVNSQVA